MTDSSPLPSRVRQACEPCRRKKTKCPGEKPSCSFCTRLNQRCTYVKSTETPGGRVEKDQPVGPKDKHRSGDRVQRLEARVDQIMDAVNILVERQDGRRILGESSKSPIPVREPHTPSVEPTNENESISGHDGIRFDSVRSPYPSFEVIQSLVRSYIERIADQPLPLFDITELPQRAPRFSPGLLESFLALTARFSNHEYYHGVKLAAVEFYKSTAQKKLMSQTADPTGALELLQGYCLLCLNEIMDGRLVPAWMALGVAARTAICTTLRTLDARRSSAQRSSISRCCWSIFILDRIYGSSSQITPAITDEDVLPEKPPCTKLPANTRDLTADSNQLEDISLDEKDEGINSYALQLLSTWGRLMRYLKTIKQGGLEDGWMANSTYQQIKSEMSRFETMFPEAHRAKNVSHHSRATLGLVRDRAYWAPWVFTQCLYHTIHCTLNHPLLHIARHGQRRLRSPSFLQHAIDQAILHCAWVVRILDTCEENQFTIHDPFVGHLVAMVATAQFFFRFSKDVSLAAKAWTDFQRLQGFIQTMAKEHRHLEHTATKLSRLARLASPESGTRQKKHPPKVEIGLLWDLLDYAISSSPSTDTSRASDDVELDVNTQFLSSPNREPRGISSYDALVGQPKDTTAPENEFWDDQYLEFDMADFSDLADFSSFNMPNSWGYGNL